MPFFENRNFYAKCDRCGHRIGFDTDHVVFPRQLEVAHRSGRIEVKQSVALSVLCLHCDYKLNCKQTLPAQVIDLQIVAQVLGTTPAEAATALDAGLVDL